MLKQVSEFASLFRLSHLPLCAWTTSRSSIHLSMNTLALGDNGALNTGVQISHEDPASSSFGGVPRSGLAGSCGDSVFNFSKNPKLFSTRSGCTRSHPPRPPRRDEGSSFPSPHLTCSLVWFGFGGSHPTECEVAPWGL